MPSAPILIGIHGVKRAGKDTTANFIEEFTEAHFPALAVRRRGFADTAKLAFARQFFPTILMDEAIKWVDTLKDDDSALFSVPLRPLHGVDGPKDTTMQFRTVLKQFATDGARDVYGFDFWVDQLLPEHWPINFALPFESSIPSVCLITDVRFHNEVDRIHQLGGYAWKVRRKEAEDAVIAEAKAAGQEIHRSDMLLPDELFDEILDGQGRDISYFQSLVNIAFGLVLRKHGYS